MPGNTELRIAEMLCTRLCHDLTGPIGAVSNGAEFLSDEEFSLQHQAVDLIVSSAAQAVSRLQFYRQAYGRVNHSGEACLNDLKQLANAFFEGTKITLDWPEYFTDASGISVGVKTARLLLNLILIAGATLIRGGTLSVKLQSLDNGGKMLEVVAGGPSIKWEPEAADALSGKLAAPMVTPKTVQLYLTGLLAQELAMQISMQESGGRFELHATQLSSMVHPALEGASGG